MPTRSLAFSALFAILAIFAARLPALATVERIDVGRLGVPGDQVSYGPRPVLSFYLPVYKSARAIHFVARLRVSPAVDPRSTVSITSDGVPQWTGTAAALRRNPVVEVTIPLPPAPRQVVEVGVTGSLARLDDDVCSRYDPNSLYLVASDLSQFVITTGASTPTIAGFFENYGGLIAIVVPPSAMPARRLAAVRLAYEIEQIARWRHARVELRSTPDPGAPNIVLGDFQTDIALRGSALEVGPNGDALLSRAIEPLLITSAVDAAKVANETLARSDSRLSLADLGIPAQTQSGGNPSFSIPFNTGLLGGLPNGVGLTVSLAHTALGPVERGSISLFVNGVLVDSVPLSAGGRQTADFAIPSALVASANDVRVRVDYNIARDCHTSFPNVTTTLFDDTSFRWSSVSAYTFGVGDFFRAASGRVAVLVDGDRNVPYAFELLSALGMGNASITSLDVLPFDGHIPKGYDAAIVVAGLDRFSGWPLPVTPQGARFALGDGAPPISATFADAFAILQTARIDGTQTLVASYWKDDAPTAGFADFGFETLAAQTGRAFVFRDGQDIYASTAPRKREVSQPFVARAGIPIGGAVVLLLVLVIVLARRKRTGGSLQ
jgi:Bacterial cellulose synthase subunit